MTREKTTNHPVGAAEEAHPAEEARPATKTRDPLGRGSTTAYTTTKDGGDAREPSETFVQVPMLSRWGIR